MADSLFDILNIATATSVPSDMADVPPPIDVPVPQPAVPDVAPVVDQAAPAVDQAPPLVDVPDIPVADAPADVPTSDQAPASDQALATEQVPAEKAKPKKRAPRRRRAASVSDSDDDCARHRSSHKRSRKLTKKTDSDSKKKKKSVSDCKKKSSGKDKHSFDKTTTSDGRHPPGYTMLKSESDKIDRTIATLIKKKESRAASGRPFPSVCGMFNDNLLKFFKGVRRDFDSEFDEYMS